MLFSPAKKIHFHIEPFSDRVNEPPKLHNYHYQYKVCFKKENEKSLLPFLPILPPPLSLSLNLSLLRFAVTHCSALLNIVRVLMVIFNSLLLVCVVLQSFQTLIYSIFFFGLISSPLCSNSNECALPNAKKTLKKKLQRSKQPRECNGKKRMKRWLCVCVCVCAPWEWIV